MRLSTPWAMPFIPRLIVTLEIRLSLEIKSWECGAVYVGCVD